MQLSHMSKSMDFNSGSFPFDNNIFILFSLMWPSLRCHRLVLVLASTTTIMSLRHEVIYRVLVFFSWANTLAPFVTFQVPLTNSIACPSSSSCPTEIRFLPRSRICRTFSSNQHTHWAVISGRLPDPQHPRLNHKPNTPYKITCNIILYDFSVWSGMKRSSWI